MPLKLGNLFLCRDRQVDKPVGRGGDPVFLPKPYDGSGIFLNLDGASCLHILQHGHFFVGGIA